MSSVDNRIVQMQFDNKQFENNIKTSTQSLDNLKKGLNLDESAKSLSNLDRVGRSFSLQGLAEGVDNLSQKFSAMSIIGVTALVNITNSAINTGKQLLESLTIAPISEGYADYGRKLTSIQTITNATGKSIKEVATYFDQLDTYADKTIYNLDDMTSALAKFTNAGVSMDKSVPAIKGIANMVALAGQDAGAAQIAFYNLSQSIAGGFLTTTDYKSLNLANVATKEWKDQMIQGAIAAGTLKKNSKGMYLIKGTKQAITEAALFNEELSKGWATTNILLDVLGKYGNEQTAIGKKALSAAQDVKDFRMMMDTLRASVGTGWTDTFEILIGNLDESKKLFTPLTNTISDFLTKVSNARNSMLQMWKDNGGRTALIEGLVNIFQSLGKVLGAVGEAFKEVFPPMSGKHLADMTKGFKDLTEYLKIGDDTAKAIKTTFKGLFSLIDLALLPVKLLAGAIGLVIKAITGNSGGLVDGFLEATSTVGNFITYLDELVKKNNIVGGTLEKIGSGISIASEYISIAITKMKDAVKEASIFIGPSLTNIKDNIIKFGSSIKDSLKPITVFAETLDGTKQPFTNAETRTDKLKHAFDGLYDTILKIRDGIVYVFKGVKSVLVPIFNLIMKKLDELSLQDIGALLTGTGLLMFAKALAKGLSSIDNILGNFSKILGEVGDTLKAFQLKVKAQALLTVAIALGILAAALVALSFIKMEDLAKSLGALTIMLAALIGSLVILNKLSGGSGITKPLDKLVGAIRSMGTAAQLITLSVGILILAGAMKIISTMDWVGLAKGTTAIAGLLTMIVVFMKLTDGLSLKSSASGLIGFSIGITILAGALSILGKLKYEQLMQGTVAIAALMTIIAAFINFTRGGDLKGSAAGLTAFAIGITILAGALSILGKLKYETLAQGTVAIAALMTIIAAFINLTNGSDLKASAGGLMGFAIGITILVGALSILGNLDIGKLTQGTLAIATLMTIIATFIMITKGGALKTSAAGLIGFGIGLMVLVGALSILGNLDPLKLIQGTTAITALMTVIAAFILITTGGDLKGSAAGLIGFSIGLIVLAEAVSILAAIDSNKIKQGVGALSTLIVVIGLFVKLVGKGKLSESAKGLIGFATGLMILAGVIAILSALNPQKLMMASTAIAVLMTSISIFVKLSQGGNLAKSSAGLIGFAVGIGILAASLIALAQLDYKQLLSAGFTLSLLVISITAFTQISKGGNILMGAAGLLVFAGALTIMAKVLTSLGSLDIKTLLMGIGAIAAIFVVLGLSALILAPLTPVILGLSAAVAILGIGCLAIGEGLLLFSNGLNNLATSGTAGALALQNAVLIIIGLIPLALTALATGLLNFIKTIGDGAPVIAEAFMKVLNSIIDTVIIMTPKILNGLAVLINSLLDFLVIEIPKMVDAGMKLILGILQGIGNNISGVVAAGINVIIQFINGVSSKLPAVIDTAFKLIITFINGLADAIRNNHNAIYAAVGNLISAIMGAYLDLIPGFNGAGQHIVDGLINGMKSKITEAATWASNLGNSIIASAKKALGIHSPSKEFGTIGYYSVMGLVNSLKGYAGLAANAAKGLGNKAIDSLSSALSGISDIINGDVDMNPTIRPVLDLSDIQNGSKQLYNMMGDLDGYAMTGTIKAANIAAGSLQNKQASTNNPSGDSITNNGGAITNTFYITGNNPKEIATEVSRILQRQVERRDAAWAL